MGAPNGVVEIHLRANPATYAVGLEPQNYEKKMYTNLFLVRNSRHCKGTGTPGRLNGPSDLQR